MWTTWKKFRLMNLFEGIIGLLCRLLTATVAWRFPAIIYIGIILSILGAALQSMTGAPRLLAAIANDDILPVLNYFKVADANEPYIATLFTVFIFIGCVVIGNLDLITPTVTMFFLLCYGGVNLSCFLLDLLDAPSWRPRWKFHHWSLSLLGASLCIGMLTCLLVHCLFRFLFLIWLGCIWKLIGSVAGEFYVFHFFSLYLNLNLFYVLWNLGLVREKERKGK